MMQPEQIAAVDLPPNSFPFTVQAHDEETGELVWETTVEAPGALTVPGFAPRKVSVTIIDNAGSETRRSDGSVAVAWPHPSDWPYGYTQEER